jgi:hypothetical protein
MNDQEYESWTVVNPGFRNERPNVLHAIVQAHENGYDNEARELSSLLVNRDIWDAGY